MTVAQAKNQFSDVLRRAEYGGERVVSRHGKPVAAIVSTDDLRRLEAADDAADVSEARAALAEAKVQGTVPLEAMLEQPTQSRPQRSPTRCVVFDCSLRPAGDNNDQISAVKRHDEPGHASNCCAR